MITGTFQLDPEKHELTLTVGSITETIQSYYFCGGSNSDNETSFHPKFITDAKTGALVKIQEYGTSRVKSDTPKDMASSRVSAAYRPSVLNVR